MNEKVEVLRKIQACNCNKPYIFVSYSSADSDLVWKDVLEFQRRGFNVWLDEKNLDKRKDSWKADALEAVSDMDCQMVVFYVSSSSLRSTACYQELLKTTDEKTMALHFGPVKFIAIDTIEVGDIVDFTKTVFDEIRCADIEKAERMNQALALDGFMKNFFNNNNEKVRIHPKQEVNRKSDYYEDILASFPEAARIFPNLIEQEAEQVRAEEEKKKKEDARIQAELKKAHAAARAAKEEAQAAMEEARKAREELAKKESEEAKGVQAEKVVQEVVPGKTVDQDRQRAVESVQAILAQKETQQPREAQPQKEREEDRFTYPVQKSADSSNSGIRIFGKKQKKDLEREIKNGLYRIPDGYTKTEAKIFGSIFQNTLDMIHLYLPDSIREISMDEFRGCSNLEDVRLSPRLTEIPLHAFQDCTSLKMVELPGDVTKIDAKAFEGCKSLESVKLPFGLERIGFSAFEDCESLKAIELPPQLRELEMYAFNGCSSLKSIRIPGTVSNLPDSVFRRCTALEEIYLEEGVQVVAISLTDGRAGIHIWFPRSITKIECILSLPERTVFHVYAGSEGERYAKEHRLPYEIRN